VRGTLTHPAKGLCPSAHPLWVHIIHPTPRSFLSGKANRIGLRGSPQFGASLGLSTSAGPGPGKGTISLCTPFLGGYCTRDSAFHVASPGGWSVGEPLLLRGTLRLRVLGRVQDRQRGYALLHTLFNPLVVLGGFASL
jgi:hypothetical protein